MSNKITDEQLRQTPFGRFVNIQEDTADETDNIDADIPSYESSLFFTASLVERSRSSISCICSGVR